MRKAVKHKPRHSEPTQRLELPDYASQSTAAAVAHYVTAEAQVLLFSCTSTHLVQMLHAQGCQITVVGVEAALVEPIATYCDRILVDHLDHVNLSQELDASQFEVVIAEIPDHRQDFLAVLHTGRHFLQPNGYVIAVVLDDYPKAIQKLFTDGGFTIVHLERQQSDPKVPATIVVAYPLPPAAIPLLQGHIERTHAENEAAQREVVRLQQWLAELQQVVREQARYLDALEIVAGNVERLLENETRLKAIQFNVNEQLLQRTQRIITMLASTAQQERPPDDRAQIPVLPSLPDAPRAERPTPAKKRSSKEQPEYQQLVQQIRTIAEKVLPMKCIVAVVSKGDDELLQLGTRQGVHFPQTNNGTYAGHYPADSAAAISHLEALRARGSRFFMLPNTAYWWLEHYQEFSSHLDSRYQQIWKDEYCIIYQLSS